MDVQGQHDGEGVVKRRPTLNTTTVPLVETTPPPPTSYSGEDYCVFSDCVDCVGVFSECVGVCV